MRRVVPPEGLPARLTGLPTWFPGPGFVDGERPPCELGALEPSDGGVGSRTVGHLDKAEAFGAAGLPIHNDAALVHHAIRLEELAEVMIRHAKGEIAHINIHGVFLVGD